MSSRGGTAIGAALLPMLAAAGAMAAQGEAALELAGIAGRRVTVTAAVPSPCDVGYAIVWGDGSSQHLFPPPLAKGIDCATIGRFAQNHLHTYATGGHYAVALVKDGTPAAAARIELTVK